jgi:hypothetical protein
MRVNRSNGYIYIYIYRYNLILIELFIQSKSQIQFESLTNRLNQSIIGDS